MIGRGWRKQAVCGVVLAVMLVLACRAGEMSSACQITFEDLTEEAGLELYSPSFGAVFADVDNDGLDDLVVSRHALGPVLYRNLGDFRFADESAVLAATHGDRHGILAADLDNDGDRDLVIAGGGGDGVGIGTPNQVLRNLLAEEDSLRFQNVGEASGLADDSRYRTRALLPVVGADGRTVDLFAATLLRKGFTNELYRNLGDGSLRFERALDSSLHRELPSEGMDCFADLDRDGDQDLLIISRGRLCLYRNTDGVFRRERNPADAVPRVSAVAVGDLDGDGDLDVVVGTASGPSWSDFASFAGGRLHVASRANIDDAFDELVFEAAGAQIAVDMSFKAGNAGDRPDRIFIGREQRHPASAAFIVNREEAAADQVTAAAAGVYLWFEPAGGAWHMRWQHGEALPELHRVSVEAEAISGMTWLDRELITGNQQAADQVFINQGGVLEPWPDAAPWRHDSDTQVLRIEDFDNDGDLDVVGLRRREPGDEGGRPVLLVNRGDGSLEEVDPGALDTPEAKIYHAGQLVSADVDRDGRIDLFATHGWGLHPGNKGPFRIFRNVSVGVGHFVALELAGTESNRDAFGAQVELYREGELIGYRELGANDHRSQSSHVLHFGLGASGGPLAARVRWPSGLVSEHTLDEVDTVHHLSEPGQRRRSQGPES